MIGFYAFGGGFGHLVRVKTFIQNHLPDHSDYKIITSNAQSRSFFSTDKLELVTLKNNGSRVELQLQLSRIFDQYHFSSLYVDVFPSGILGEFTPSMLDKMALYHLARRLKWDRYHDDRDHYLPTYEKTFVLEPLEPLHLETIKSTSKEVAELTLRYPKPETSVNQEGYWLVIHSSSADELNLLIDHAKDMARMEKVNPEMIICSDQVIEGMKFKQVTDPLPWLENAEKIFSGAGFNTWHQLAPYRHKHVCIPFPRRFDDQFWRAQRK